MFVEGLLIEEILKMSFSLKRDFCLLCINNSKGQHQFTTLVLLLQGPQNRIQRTMKYGISPLTRKKRTEHTLLIKIRKTNIGNNDQLQF